MRYKRIDTMTAIGERPDGALEEIRAVYEAEFPPKRRARDLEAFAAGFKLACEASLYRFAKYVLDMRRKLGQLVGLSPTLHWPVCDWLQDMSTDREHQLTSTLRVAGGRRKLLMLPVVHLKTSIASHALPLHVLIQPPDHNLYFPDMPGRDARILLHGETTDKAGENAAVIRQHLESNPVLRWMWPDMMWNFVTEAPLWKASMFTVRRSGQRVLAEPTITAIGVTTGLEQRHYDLIVMDDLATLEAAQSETVMNYAKVRRKACRSRLDNLSHSIEIGVGTHWTSTDIYIDWRKDPSVQICIRAAIEDGQPIWPEKHSLEELLALRQEEQMGTALFSANYMNQPVNPGFTALDWEEVRSFSYDPAKRELVWEENPVDAELSQRNSLSGLGNANLYALHGRNFRGMSLEQLYHATHEREAEDSHAVHERRLSRLLRRRDAEEEGSAMWERLNFHYLRRQEQHD